MSMFMFSYENKALIHKLTVSCAQAKLLQSGGAVPCPSEFFVLKEESDEPDCKMACLDDSTVVVPMEFTMRGVMALWPHILQCDPLNCYTLRAPLCKTYLDFSGHLLYSVFI